MRKWKGLGREKSDEMRKTVSSTKAQPPRHSGRKFVLALGPNFFRPLFKYFTGLLPKYRTLFSQSPTRTLQA